MHLHSARDFQVKGRKSSLRKRKVRYGEIIECCFGADVRKWSLIV
jgi:hypothetical protein